MKYFYIVGIDGRKTPEPNYWYDRWKCIEAENEQEALQLYFEMKKNWLREEEYKLVQVWAKLDKKVWVDDWIKENMK